jgi:hypothetical protein
VSATRYPTLIPKSSRMGRITIGVSAAPTAHEVTGQKEFGKCASEMSNLSLIARGALVTTAALKPTMKVLRRCQLDRAAEEGAMADGSMVVKGESKKVEHSSKANPACASRLFFLTHGSSTCEGAS